MKARVPKPQDIKLIQRLLVSAGSQTQLIRWIKQLPKTRAGRPKVESDEYMLAGADLLRRLGMKQGIPSHTMLKMLVARDPGKPDSNARRLARKLRERKFTLRELRQLLKAHGVPNPRKVTLRAIDDQ
jgi:hypothetical protein